MWILCKTFDTNCSTTEQHITSATRLSCLHHPAYTCTWHVHCTYMYMYMCSTAWARTEHVLTIISKHWHIFGKFFLKYEIRGWIQTNVLPFNSWFPDCRAPNLSRYALLVRHVTSHVIEWRTLIVSQLLAWWQDLGRRRRRWRLLLTSNNQAQQNQRHGDACELKHQQTTKHL